MCTHKTTLKMIFRQPRQSHVDLNDCRKTYHIHTHILVFLKLSLLLISSFIKGEIMGSLNNKNNVTDF